MTSVEIIEGVILEITRAKAAANAKNYALYLQQIHGAEKVLAAFVGDDAAMDTVNRIHALVQAEKISP